MDARSRTRLDLIERSGEVLCRIRREEDETHCAVFIKEEDEWMRPYDATYPCGECRVVALELHRELYEEVMAEPVPA